MYLVLGFIFFYCSLALHNHCFCFINFAVALLFGLFCINLQLAMFCVFVVFVKKGYITPVFEML